MACLATWCVPPFAPCLHLSVTVLEHVGKLLSSVAAAGAADASGVAGAVVGAAVASGAVAGAEASGVAGIAGGGVVGAGVASCAMAAVLSAKADAKRIIFIFFLQPFVGELNCLLSR